MKQKKSPAKEQIQAVLQSFWKLTSFDEKLDTNSTSDTGAESIRLANQSIKTGLPVKVKDLVNLY